ncbi:MAG: histidine--tRNA ligase, partial [Sphingomicrobium sp.]
YERPQKGRFRQFHQLDAEVIGSGEPAADVELLAFGAQLLAELGIGGVRLKLNTLGDAASRDAWRAQLVEHFAAHRAELSEDSQARLDKNPLRILDSKDPRDRTFADSAPPMVLSGEAEDFFGAVKAGLDAAGVDYEISPHLVRGLDYYRHTAFEFLTDQLGAQGTVIAGGRYDGLIEQLDGPHTPAVGWAAGIERLAMLIEAPAQHEQALRIIPNRSVDEPTCLKVLSILRQAGVPATMAFRGKAKRHFELARRDKVTGTLTVDTQRQIMANAGEIAELTLHPTTDGVSQWPALKQAVADALSAIFYLRTFTFSEDLSQNSTWHMLARA